MAETDHIYAPLVSVIIPCYNHGHFLPVAINSVLQQSYNNIEIILVDDGSTDTTCTVARSFNQVKYIYQHNSGLSASRNKGIKNSKGEFIICLDADDWLYEDAVKINMNYLIQKPEAAFVSGGYDKIFTDIDLIVDEKREIKDKHYIHLLKHGNFITVPAAVMYQAWVFKEFQFDTELPACEDYDLYLKISRRYPVIHHTKKVAAYQRHASNMSSNDKLMIETALQVLDRQKDFVKTTEELKAITSGKDRWKGFYCNEIYKKLKANHIKPSVQLLLTMFRYKPKYLAKYVLLKLHLIE